MQRRHLAEPCPDCGGQKGSTIEATLDRKTGARLRPLPAVIGGVLGFALAAAAGYFAVLVLPDVDYESRGVVPLLIFAFGIAGWLARPAQRFAAAARVRGLRSTCKGCGHVWIDSAEVNLPPLVPGVHWLSCSDEYLWGRNREKTSYFIFSRADLSAPVHTYPATEMDAGKAQFRALAGTWWVAAGTRQPHAHTGGPLLPPAPPKAPSPLLS